MKQFASDDSSPTFGLRIGTHEAVLAINYGGDRRLVKVADEYKWIPVNVGFSNEETVIGKAVDDEVWPLSVSPEEPFVADPVNRAGDHSCLFVLKEFLQEARNQWLDGVSNETTLPVVVSLPGAYDKKDEDRILATVKASGFDPIGAVREPLSVGYESGLHTQNEGTYLLARVGTFWLDVALVQPDPDNHQITTLLRQSYADLGSDLYERTIAEWLRTQKNKKIAGLQTDGLKEIIRKAIETANETNNPVQSDERIGIELDVESFDRPLEGIIADLGGNLREFISDADMGDVSIDGVILTGPGSIYPMIQRAFAGNVSPNIHHIGGSTQPWDGPSALGASLIGAAYGSKIEQVDSSLRRPLAIELLTSSGSEYHRLNQLESPTQAQINLRTTVDDQTRGQFRIGAVHRSTGDVKIIENVEVSKLPPAPAGEIEFTVRMEATDTVPTGCHCDVSLLDGAFETPIEIKTVEHVDKNGPWFIDAEQDLEAIDVPDYEEFEPEYRYNPDADAYESLSPKQAIDRVVDIRNELWQTAKNNIEMSSDDLLVRVNKMDIGLQRSGISLIAPDPGENINDMLHHIDKVQTADQSKGSIIDVRLPGYKIDDHVESKARVVVSSGPPKNVNPDTEDQSTSETNGQTKVDSKSETTTEQETDTNGDEDVSGESEYHNKNSSNR